MVANHELDEALALPTTTNGETIPKSALFTLGSSNIVSANSPISERIYVAAYVEAPQETAGALKL